MTTELTKGNTESWFETIWNVIENAERNTDDPEKWDDVKTAMAWIREEVEGNRAAQHADRDVLADIVHYSVLHHESQLRFLKRHHELEEAKENRRLDSLKAFQKSLDL